MWGGACSRQRVSGSCIMKYMIFADVLWKPKWHLYRTLWCWVLFESECWILDYIAKSAIHRESGNRKCFTNSYCRDRLGYGLSQWETTLQCNVVSIGWAHIQNNTCFWENESMTVAWLFHGPTHTTVLDYRIASWACIKDGPWGTCTCSIHNVTVHTIPKVAMFRDADGKPDTLWSDHVIKSN